jgi:hypothetical protein
MIKKIILCFVILSIVAGCSVRPRVGPLRMKQLLYSGPRNGSTIFNRGWVDGCETGISVTSNRMQRHFYRFKQDYYLANNSKEYYTAWKAAYTFCQRYVFQYLRRRYF